MLELRKLLDDVAEMSEEIARRRETYKNLADVARAKLAETPVDEALHAKIALALTADSTWRGAEPLEAVLDLRHRPQTPAEDASLIGVDGSQIYPDRHGPALYYLINVGSMVLRQGSGLAPATDSTPDLFYAERDLYDEEHNLVGAEQVNSFRELAEMRALARLALAERGEWGGDRDRLVVAMKDGQLMMWINEREQKETQARNLEDYISQLDLMRQSAGVPAGFVARPRSANVVRLLWVAGLKAEDINMETVRKHGYRALTDRTLFAGLLGPNERSALFANTAQVNREQFQAAGQRICSFYLNIARERGPDRAQIARVDVPEWAAKQPSLLDRVQNAIYNDCAGADYPYVLVRADELAVVSRQEKQDLEQMLNIATMRMTGESLESSPKAVGKEQSRGYTR